MRRHWLHLAVSAAIGATSACRSQAPELEAPVGSHVGVYRFAIRTVNGLAVEGKFMVLADTVIVDAVPGPCWYARESNLMAVAYRCGEISLLFDRTDPVNRSKYRGTVTVTEQQTVCVRYATNSRGQRSCAETSVQSVDRRVAASGRIEAVPDSRP